MGVQEDLRALGIEIRPSHREFADLQEHKAIEILRDLLMRLEEDDRLMLGELEIMERRGQAGQRIIGLAIHRQRSYAKVLRRVIKVLESAEARRARAD